ncbi:unnamed protein product [Symbiodinium natans]|uniref:Uncharacterized protein n=1 Tax=Symbiodinium natans TaxID=878477 RepID=A0A812R025_9DINO|nr:unnamed protein product [Symbiodinium natans]
MAVVAAELIREVTEADQRFEGLQKKLTAVSEKVDDIEHHMQDKHQQLSEDLQQEVSDLGQEFQASHAELKDNLTGGIGSLAAHIESEHDVLAGKLNQTAGAVSGAKDAAEQLKGSVGELGQSVSSLAGKVGDLQGNTAALKGAVDATADVIADAGSAVRITQTVAQTINAKLRGPESCCSAEDAKNVLIIQSPSASAAKTFDRLGSIVAAKGGNAFKKLLSDVTVEDFKGVSTVIFSPQGAAADSAMRARLVTDWYNYNKCGVLVVLAELATGSDPNDAANLANSVLESLSPSTDLRVSANQLGPDACAADQIEAYGADPFFTAAVSGLMSTSSNEVLGGGRALLNIGSKSIARLDHTDRLLVIGDDDFLNDECYASWTQGHRVYWG